MYQIESYLFLLTAQTAKASACKAYEAFTKNSVLWKRKWKLEAEAPEAAIFYGSGSNKREMNVSGSG